MESANTYRVKIVRPKDRDAGWILRHLERRQKKEREMEKIKEMISLKLKCES